MTPDASSDRWRYYCAGALLLHLPACLAVASTYIVYGPRQFSSTAVFTVRWNHVDRGAVRQALRDTAWNRRANDVEFTSLRSSADPPPFGTTTYSVTAFAPRPEDAQQAATGAREDLTWKFNDLYGHRSSRPSPEPMPITLFPGTTLPAAPARPDVRLVKALGTGTGLTFIALGLGVCLFRRTGRS
jgi:hypothetical protein